ncbi:hypothetical protein GY21_11045 [Cryobacterium roopkundense]|uniref:DNA mismatch repair protein n=1 Tax=Cryobacterium roopkundense TaxID=1001240 RepID=A0A099J7M5_9MICO|nr:hypothetical protein [Cryobacterium roopkundense]KGJ73502.1 hypothetical protein GY21_11045 [Cryobacterium roopkundense]MBB5641537.1 hypothetical protein [Cryobacterium roopkundense]
MFEPVLASVATATVRGLSLVPVKAGLWRVANRSGTILGHIERQSDADGDRFAARRLVFASRMVDLGVFCRMDDAADCFRC